jgi:heptosyltransferase I
MTACRQFAEPQRIALIKPSALGDIMNSLPVLTALRQHYPSAHISWIVNRVYEPILHGHPDLDETIPFERSMGRQGAIEGPLAMLRFVRKLRRRRFDLVIDLQGLLRTGLMCFATGASRRLGLKSAREGASLFYTEVVDDRHGSPHAVDRYWRVAEHLGIGAGPKAFRLPEDSLAGIWADETLETYAKPRLALAVGSRWITKRWPPEHFAELARRAQRAFGGTVVLLGAPDEADLARQTAALIEGPALNLAGSTSLVQLSALLARMDVVLSNDTGPLHVAVALGRPIVAPYTCTRVDRNGPYGQEHRAVETLVHCQGSYLRQCARLECMKELTPDRLWPILHGILQSWKLKQQSAQPAQSA